MEYVSLILIALAAVFDAIQDTLYAHFSTSVFSRLNPKFWRADVSWEFATRVFEYPVDAWHLAKSAKLLLVLAAVVLYHPSMFYSTFKMFGGAPWALYLGDFVMLGVVHVLVFNLFYNKILYRPNRSR